jgi:hypothetical protein
MGMGDGLICAIFPIVNANKPRRAGCPSFPLNYLKDSEGNRKMCSLCLSLMDRFDVKLEQFGVRRRGWSGSRADREQGIPAGGDLSYPLISRFDGDVCVSASAPGACVSS